MTRSTFLTLAAIPALLLAVSGCSTSAPAAEPTSSVAAPDAATEPLTSVPAGDADWECGHASALMGIQFRTEWELANGVIDQAAFDARAAALVDSWTYLPTGQSDVTAALRAAMAEAAQGIGPENPDFSVATQQLVSACDAAGSITIVSALPERSEERV